MIKDHIQRGDYTNHIAPKLIFSAIRITGAIAGIFLSVYWTGSFSRLSDVLGNLPVLLFYA